MITFTDIFPIRYRYSSKPVLSSTADIVYGYNNYSYEEALPGYLAVTTQTIANQLPYWMKMRRDQTSDGWKLLNALGMGFDAFLDLQDELDSGHTPEGMLWMQSNYYTPNLTSAQLNSLVPGDVNLLRNPEFSPILGTIPGWKSSGVIVVGTPTETAATSCWIGGSLVQTSVIPETVGTFHVGANMDSNVVVQLILHGKDNYSIAGQMTGSSLMERVSMEVQVTQPVYYMEFVVNSTGGAIAAPTVSFSTSEWITGTFPDVYGHPAYTTRKLAGFVQGSWQLIRPVAHRFLLTNFFPTRVSRATTLDADRFFGATRQIATPLDEGTAFTAESLGLPTELSPYLALVDYRGTWVRLPISLDVKAIAVANDSVFAIAKSGSDTWLLIAPHATTDGTTIQFVQALQLDEPVDDMGTMHVSTDMKQLVLKLDTGEERVYDLFYDYYFIDDMGEVGMLEKYSTLGV